MRIVPRQELQQELVQVEAADERQALAAADSAPSHSARISVCSSPLPGPRHEQRLKREQHAAQRRLRPARALRDHRDAPEIAGEKLDDEARLLERIAVQDERGLRVLACRIARRRSRAAPSPTRFPCASARPRRPPSRFAPCTQISRKTLPPNSRSMSWRAWVLIAFSFSPPLPMTIASGSPCRPVSRRGCAAAPPSSRTSRSRPRSRTAAPRRAAGRASRAPARRRGSARERVVISSSS